MITKIFRGLALFAALAPSLRASGDLPAAAGPDDLIAHARTHNAALAAAQARTEAARARIGQATALPDPELMYGYYLRRMETRQTVSVSQPFPFPGTLSRRGAVAEAEAGASFHAAEATRLAIEERIRVTYAELALLDESIRLAASNITLLERVTDIIDARLRSGRTGGAELIRTEVARVRLEDERDRLAARRPALVAEMNALLGRDWGAELPQLHSLADLVHGDSASTASRRLANPELDALDRSIEARREAIELARREGLPGFSAGLEWMDNRGGARDEVRLMVGVRLPLWRERYRSAEREARADQRALEAEQLDLRRRLEAEIRRAEDTLTDARRRIDLYEGRLLERAREALETEESAYQAGGSDLLNVIDAQRVLLDLELTHRQALANAYTAAASLRRLTGND